MYLWFCKCSTFSFEFLKLESLLEACFLLRPVIKFLWRVSVYLFSQIVCSWVPNKRLTPLGFFQELSIQNNNNNKFEYWGYLMVKLDLVYK